MKGSSSLFFLYARRSTLFYSHMTANILPHFIILQSSITRFLKYIFHLGKVTYICSNIIFILIDLQGRFEFRIFCSEDILRNFKMLVCVYYYYNEKEYVLYDIVIFDIKVLLLYWYSYPMSPYIV